MAIKYTKGEERTNYISHAGGILLGLVVGVCFLVYCYRHENLWMQWGVWLYMFGMLGSYITSTIYHACSATSKWKEKLRKWDHAAIYWCLSFYRCAEGSRSEAAVTRCVTLVGDQYRFVGVYFIIGCQSVNANYLNNENHCDNNSTDNRGRCLFNQASA